MKIIIKFIIAFLYLILITIYIDNKYIERVEIDSIYKFELCYDNCVTLELTETESMILENEISTYDFQYNMNDYNDVNDYKIIRINEYVFYYRYIDSSKMGEVVTDMLNPSDIYYLIIEKDNKYFSLKTEKENNLMKIVDRYFYEYNDVLVN